MESKTNNNDRLNKILQESKNYFNLKLDLFTLNFNQKLASLISYFLAFYALLFLVLLFFFFVSFGFVFWWEDNVGKIQYGFLVVAFFYLILGVLIFRFRRRLILNPLLNFISSIFSLFSDENEEKEQEERIRSIDDLMDKKEKVRNKMDETEKNIELNMDQIAKTFSPQYLVHKYTEKLGDKISERILENEGTFGHIARKMKNWLDGFSEDEATEEPEKPKDPEVK